MDAFEGRDNDPLSLDKYLYANANPVNMLDPSGRDIFDVLGALAIGLVLEATVAPSTAINGIQPNYHITLEKVTKDPSLGFFKQFRVAIVGPNASNRFLVVQWLKGYFKIGDHFGGPYLHQDVQHFYNYPNWEIDSFSQVAEYPGNAGATSLTKSGDTITMYDSPGLLIPTGLGLIIPSSTSLTAALDFRVNVYDKWNVSNYVTGFQSVDNPRPLLSIPWEFHDSYVVP